MGPAFDGHALIAQREQDAAPLAKSYDVAAAKLAPFSQWSLRAAEAPWLIIKNLDQGERGRSDRFPTTSTTMCSQPFDERAALPRKIDPGGL